MVRIPPIFTSSDPDNRGQALQVDALVGLVILLGATTTVVFATGISPNIIAQPQAEAFEEDVSHEVKTVLSASHQDGSLKETALSWNDSSGEFEDGQTQTIASGAYFNHPDTRFGDRLSEIEDIYGVSINVQLVPNSNDDSVEPKELIITTPGGGDRIIERKTITLYENDYLQSPASAHSRISPGVGPSVDGGVRLKENEEYGIDRGDHSQYDEDETERYNTVVVEVLVYDV